MDKTKLTLLALAASAALTGCEPAQPSADEERAYVEDEAQKQVRQTLASDEDDRKKTLAELQAQDPTVKDVYFSYNEKGEKQVHIVKETADGQNSDTMWPLLGGMAAGYLLAKAMTSSPGGMSGYAQQHRPLSSSTYAEDERRRRMNSVSSANSTMMMNSARNSVRSSPNFQSKMSSTVMSSRSTGVMSGSSARAASHGSASS